MISKHLRTLLFAIVITFFLALTVVVYLNHTYKSGIKVGKVRISKAEVEIDRVNYTETKNGKTVWRLEAESAKYLRKEKLAIFNDVMVTFYAADGGLYTLKGREGRFWEDIGDIEIRGNVEAITEDGYKLNTDSLRYIASTEVIMTDDAVRLDGPKVSIDGVGLFIYVKKDTLSVPRKVRMVIQDVAL